MAFAVDQQQYIQGYLPIVFLTSTRATSTPSAAACRSSPGPGFVTPENAAQVKDLAAAGTR